MHDGFESLAPIVGHSRVFLVACYNPATLDTKALARLWIKTICTRVHTDKLRVSKHNIEIYAQVTNRELKATAALNGIPFCRRCLCVYRHLIFVFKCLSRFYQICFYHIRYMRAYIYRIHLTIERMLYTSGYLSQKPFRVSVQHIYTSIELQGIDTL